MSPVVLASAERVPGGLELLLPSLVLRYQPPERSEVDDDAVIEVRVPERRDALYLFEKRPQLLDEALLVGQLLTLRGRGYVTKLTRQRFEPPFLLRELRRGVVVLNAEESVLAARVDVKNPINNC